MNEIYIIVRIVSIVFDNSTSYRQYIVFTHYEKKRAYTMFNFLKLDNQNDTFEMQLYEKNGEIFELRDVIK